MKNFKYCNINFYLRSENVIFNKDGSKFCKIKKFLPSKEENVYALFMFDNNQYILFLEYIDFEIKNKVATNKFFNFAELFYDPNNILREKFGKKYKNYDFEEKFLNPPYYHYNNDDQYKLKEKVITKGELALISTDIVKIYERYLSLTTTMEIFK